MSAEVRTFLLAVAASVAANLIVEYILNNVGSVRRAVR
jgi:hypothetical protein